ncbi:hypothetical protein [Stenotrophomonas sp.]|uniref:hypothetical protein n=1 Tax=Stenotrophomonas sp. TaxID=69392 RepID=UPI0028AC1047|nr:hypothetical protein [Stenotrophomonas sp.]
MYTRLLLTSEKPSAADAYVGGGAFLPENIPWPTCVEGHALFHLMAIPAHWFYRQEIAEDFWFSIFIPVDVERHTHLRQLRAVEGISAAVVLAYRRGSASRSRCMSDSLERGRIERIECLEPDDDENLDSKLDGVDAWLQSTLAWNGGRRRLMLYGADIDGILPSHNGVLSDGMAYLFLPDQPDFSLGGRVGAFFLQLG